MDTSESDWKIAKGKVIQQTAGYKRLLDQFSETSNFLELAAIMTIVFRMTGKSVFEDIFNEGKFEFIPAGKDIKDYIINYYKKYVDKEELPNVRKYIDDYIKKAWRKSMWGEAFRTAESPEKVKKFMARNPITGTYNQSDDLMELRGTIEKEIGEIIEDHIKNVKPLPDLVDATVRESGVGKLKTEEIKEKEVSPASELNKASKTTSQTIPKVGDESKQKVPPKSKPENIVPITTEAKPTEPNPETAQVTLNPTPQETGLAEDDKTGSETILPDSEKPKKEVLTKTNVKEQEKVDTKSIPALEETVSVEEDKTDSETILTDSENPKEEVLTKPNVEELEKVDSKSIPEGEIPALEELKKEGFAEESQKPKEDISDIIPPEVTESRTRIISDIKLDDLDKFSLPGDGIMETDIPETNDNDDSKIKDNDGESDTSSGSVDSENTIANIEMSDDDDPMDINQTFFQNVDPQESSLVPATSKVTSANIRKQCSYVNRFDNSTYILYARDYHKFLKRCAILVKLHEGQKSEIVYMGIENKKPFLYTPYQGKLTESTNLNKQEKLRMQRPKMMQRKRTNRKRLRDATESETSKILKTA